MSLRSVSFAVMLFITGDVLLVSGAQAACDADSADVCLSRANISDLPPASNVTYYCRSALVLANKISSCLEKCNFTETDAILQFFSQVNSTCSVAGGCSNSLDLYAQYWNCFDKNGGLEALIDDLVSDFNSRKNIDRLCRSLASGRTCQKLSIAGCPYARELDLMTYSSVDLLRDAQYICGSENVPDVSDNSACGNSVDMINAIQKECDISCSISATSDPSVFCALLQDQANCILRNSRGCTAVERRFLLPRLNSYGIANLLLECPNLIKVRGVAVQPTGLGPNFPDEFRCKYTPQINDCFCFNLSESVRADSVVKLLNGNFILDQFCQLKQNNQLFVSQLVSNCADSLLRCRLPTAEVYEPVSAYDNSYNISLGPIPLDAWGLNTLLSTLTCPNYVPPTLCQISSSRASSPGTLRPTPTVTRRQTPIRNITNLGRPTPALRKKNK